MGGLRDKFLKRKNGEKDGDDQTGGGAPTDPASQFVTKQDIQAILGPLLKQSADIAIRATDERQQQWLSKSGTPVGAPRNSEDAKDLRQLIYTPQKNRMREMTVLNPKECALEPWLWTLADAIKPNRPHGSLLSTFLFNKEQCNRSLDGFLLTQTVTMAGMETQREGFTDSHISS
jgi:hypothetical protein